MTTAPTLRPPQDFFLPAGYRQQQRNLTLDDNRDADAYWSPWRVSESARWQRHVYEWAAKLGKAHACHSALDVGCGVGTKLKQHLIPVFHDVEGLDQPSALAIARKQGIRSPLTPVDLENPPTHLPRQFDLILCADVVEHLVDPDPMLAMIRSAAHESTIVLISTPERDRERGRDCRSSDKPEHVREWSRDEFRRFLVSRGFSPVASRLLPKDDADRGQGHEQEVSFRLKQAAKSPWCCQAWLCKVPGAATKSAHSSRAEAAA